MTKKIIFEGRVQGIGFRYSTKQLALGFDVIGWVKNLTDGTVELVLEGDDEEIDEFIVELVEESALAYHIKNHIVEEIPPLSGVKGFIISN
mgnify:CR=1 FL=1